MNKKGGFLGVMIIWVAVLAGIFTVNLVYMGMTESIDMLDTVFNESLNGTHQETYDYLKTSWNEWPIWFSIVFIIFGIVGTVVQTQDQSYGY